MPLYEIQKMMGAVLLKKKGAGILDDPSQWKSFCHQNAYQEFERWPQNRLKLYEELLFAGIESTLSSLYPFCRRFFNSRDWHQLVEQYRRQYPSASYQLYKSAEAFPQFLSEQEALMTEIPFLIDLSHYEWLEVVLLNAKDMALPNNLDTACPSQLTTLSAMRPYWNPISHLYHCRYPIPSILDLMRRQEDLSPPYPFKKQSIDILLYRDMDTLSVRFFQLNELTSQLWQLCQTGKSYLEVFQLLQKNIAALHSIDFRVILEEGFKLLKQCHQEGILLGSLPVSIQR